MSAVETNSGTSDPRLRRGMDRVVIATYVGIKYKFDFILRDNDVVVKVYKQSQCQGEFNLNPSYRDIKAVPGDERSS